MKLGSVSSFTSSITISAELCILSHALSDDKKHFERSVRSGEVPFKISMRRDGSSPSFVVFLAMDYTYTWYKELSAPDE